MTGKILIGMLVALSILLSSCYPELSVQQYDKLREDLKALDVQRQELQAELEAVKTELTAIKAKNTEMRAYVGFLEKLVSTQSSEMILTGEFDAGSLVSAKEGLTTTAETLKDNQITYYLGLMDGEHESQTVGAYYKVIEYCLKKMKQYLE